VFHVHSILSLLLCGFVLIVVLLLFVFFEISLLKFYLLVLPS